MAEEVIGTYLIEDKYRKYQPIHVDIYDTTLLNIIAEALDPDLLKNHRVTEIVRRPNKQWTVRLEYDFMKDSQERAKVQF